MQQMSFAWFTFRRMADNWKLLLSVFFGITIAATLVTGAPIYLKSLERIGYASAIETSSSIILNILTTAQDVPISHDKLQNVEQSLDETIQRNISPIYRDHQRYLKTNRYLLNPTPTISNPKFALALPMQTDAEQGEEDVTSTGYLINLQDLEKHVTLLQGRMAGDTITGEAPLWTPVVEAVVGGQLADDLGLEVGEIITLASAADQSTRVSARIVGIVEPNDVNETYWRGRAGLFFAPQVPEEEPIPGIEVDRSKPPTALIITPTAAAKLPNELVEPAGYRFLRAYFANLSDLENHVTFLEGRMAGDAISTGQRGPVVEAVVGTIMAGLFDLSVGDVITVTPFIDESTWMSVRIVGIVERTDRSDEYWLWGTNTFFERRQPGAPPLPLLVSRETLVRGVEGAYPGTLVDSVWYIFVNKDGLKDWSIPEVRIRLRDLENGITETLPGNITSTGIKRVLTSFERRFFFASVPLLLLLATMVATVLYFLSMTVSYLAQSRESDVTLLKTRGVGMFGFLRLYGLEALAVTLAGVALAPFLAILMVAFAGKLPYFRQLTGGDFLPVEIGPLPFILATGLGLLCFLIYIVPTMLVARAGLVAQRLRMSRPPLIPAFYRYKLDIGLLVLGGLIFWELRSRGQLVAGGLFEDVQINETLLIAPVLLLVVVASMFVRLFPLVLRFITGESSALLDLLVVATAAGFGLVIVTSALREGEIQTSVGTIALAVLIVAAYWATVRSQINTLRFFGLAVQVGLASALIATERPSPGDDLFIPIVAMAGVVPGQLLFFFFKSFANVAPSWVSLALWRMARHPTRYTWLMLLLVLATGLATFANTVRATLDGRDEDHVSYYVPTDIRVTVAQTLTDGWDLKEKYSGVSGIDTVSPAFRVDGLTVHSLGRPFELLALESSRFQSISWYRQDFSDNTFGGIMRALQPNGIVRSVTIPDDSKSIGIWAKLAPDSPTVSLEMMIQDDLGNTNVLTLGEVDSRDWALLSANLPSNLEPPAHLVSIYMNLPDGEFNLPGTVLIDDIIATGGVEGKEKVLDGFEGRTAWTPLATSLSASESVFSYVDDARRGNSVGVYTFERTKSKGAAGIYLSPTGGPLPIVASSSFMADSGVRVGDTFIGSFNGRRIPLVIRDTVDYFPTMTPGSSGFVIADLDLLLEHLAISDPENLSTPNEFFLDVGPTADSAVSRDVSRVAPLITEVTARESQTQSFRLNPLITAGWRAMSLASLAIVLFTAVTGYVIYMLVFIERNLHEMGLVRALGLGNRQMFGLLTFEHLTITVTGMGLGTWAGFRMSTLMLPLVSVDVPGESVVPPILIVTDWTTLTAIYSVMAACFAVMLLYLIRRIFRMDLQSISKVEL